MTDISFKEQLKKKALDRRENEGGKFYDDRSGDRSPGIRKGTKPSPPNRVTSDDRKGNSSQINSLAGSSLRAGVQSMRRFNYS